MRQIIIVICLAALLAWALLNLQTKPSLTDNNKQLVNECFDAHLVNYSTTQLSIMGQPAVSKTTLDGQLFSRHWFEGDVEYSLFIAKNMTFIPLQMSALLQVFEQPLLAKRDANGFFTDLYFSNNTSDTDEKLLSGSILPFQSASILGVHKTYDSLGTYKAKFTKESKRFIKNKLLYLKNPTTGVDIETNIQVANSSETYQFDECWLNIFEGEQSLNIEAFTTKQPMLSLDSKVSLYPYRVEDNPLEKFRGFSAEDIIKEFNIGEKATKSHQDIAAEQTNNKRIEELNLTTEAFIDRVLSPNVSIADYALYLRTQPALLSDIVNKVLGGETTSRQTMFLTELLAHVGNNFAQQALVDISHATNLTLNARIQAIAAFTSLQIPPTDYALSALMQYHASLDSGELTELATTASLALGALAKSISDKTPMLRDEIIQRLTDGLVLSTAPHSKRAQLIALANASPVGLPNKSFTTFLADENSSVRLAAIALLSKIATDETIQTLLNYEKSEVDVTVRAEVFKQLSQTRLLANHLEQVVNASLSESSASVRSHMIQLLGHHIETNPELFTSLEQLKNRENNQDNRSQIAKYLNARKRY